MNYSDAAGIVAQNLHVFWRIRSDLRFEKQLTEERRKQNEINMVRLAMAASENAILNMLQSEMGQTFIIAIAKKLYIKTFRGIDIYILYSTIASPFCGKIVAGNFPTTIFPQLFSHNSHHNCFQAC